MSLAQQSIYQWNNTPDILKHQIEVLSEHFKTNEDVKNEYKRLKEDYESMKLGDKIYKGKELHKVFLHTCIFKHISALQASKSRFFKDLLCYNERGEPIIELVDNITVGKYVKLFSARFICPENYPDWGNRPIVVKLYESRDGIHTTNFEIDMYRYLGDPSPSLGVNAYLWNIPVLVMKPMKPLCADDDELDIGIQVLEQLPALHQFTVHSDIKPDNIMREKGTKPRIYRLIDFGGCARERLSDGKKSGFKRRTWSAKWTTQKRRAVVTNPKYDLLELGHTLTALKFMRESGKNRYPSRKRRTFTGRLKQYMDYVEEIDDVKIKHNQYGIHYLNLIDILRGKKELNGDDKGDKDGKSNNKSGKSGNGKSSRNNNDKSNNRLNRNMCIDSNSSDEKHHKSNRR